MPRTQAEIESELRSAYAVDAETCARSVDRLLGRMRELQLAMPN
jgi:hypothetical protein